MRSHYLDPVTEILGIDTGRERVPMVENLDDSPRIIIRPDRQTAQGDPRVLNCAEILCVYPHKISALKRIYIWWPPLLYQYVRFIHIDR